METTPAATHACALARAVAVMGDGAPAAAAARLAGLAVDDGERAADVLSAVGILAPCRPLRFVHPAARALLYASLPPGERAIAHRRAVRVLGEAGAAPTAIAVHACSVEPADDRFVAEALVTAGRRALAAGAPQPAAILLERALAEPPPPGARAPARVLLGRALTLLGDRRAPIVTSEALATAARHERPAIAAVLVDALWLTGGADAGLALACAMAGGEPPGVAAARAACAGSLSAGEIAQAAADGVQGATAFERCLAIAALIACDELEVARRALGTCARAAVVRGAGEELALLERLRLRLRFVEGAGPADAPPLDGPDPGPDPWQAWCAGGAARRFGTPSARAAALLASPGDIGAIELAVSLLRGSPRRADLARALLTLGRALRHGGRRRDARVTLTEAVSLAQRLGRCDLARSARDELNIAGARPRRERMTGPDSLTAAERRVADAAAAGSSNRDIARDLFLSPKTVEMHLGRVYRKLDIGSRGDLRGVLGDQLAAAA